MRKLVLLAALVALAFGLGALWAYQATRPKEKPLPDGPAVVERIREVARLQTLDVALYKKVEFSPDPPPPDSLWAATASWARYAFRTPRAKAIVFAEGHLGIDLHRLSAEQIAVRGRRVEIVLPPVEAQVELRPGETEIIGSNLDSQETAQLLQAAKEGFQRQLGADAELRERARESARQSLRALLFQLGFVEVVFVPHLSPAPRAG